MSASSNCCSSHSMGLRKRQGTSQPGLRRMRARTSSWSQSNKHWLDVKVSPLCIPDNAISLTLPTRGGHVGHARPRFSNFSLRPLPRVRAQHPPCDRHLGTTWRSVGPTGRQGNGCRWCAHVVCPFKNQGPGRLVRCSPALQVLEEFCSMNIYRSMRVCSFCSALHPQSL